MEERPPLKTVLLFVNFGILLVFFAINVESQQQQNGTRSNGTSSQPPSRLIPPVSHSPSPAPSPRMANHSSAKSPNELNTHSQSNHRNRTHKKGIMSFNVGQKIGLLFAGIVAILQVSVVGFLAFKRRQLLKMHDR